MAKLVYVVVFHNDEDVLPFKAAFPTFEKAAMAIVEDVAETYADDGGPTLTQKDILLSMLTYGRRKSPTRWVYESEYMEGDRYVVALTELEE